MRRYVVLHRSAKANLQNEATKGSCCRRQGREGRDMPGKLQRGRGAECGSVRWCGVSLEIGLKNAR